MEREQLAKIIRKDPAQVAQSIAGETPGRAELKIACAMNEEWWRGFYAGQDSAGVRALDFRDGLEEPGSGAPQLI